MKRIVIVILVVLSLVSCSREFMKKNVKVTGNNEKKYYAPKATPQILIVTSIQNTKNGFVGTFKNDKNEKLVAEFAKEELKNNYVELQEGDKVIIEGDYSGFNPITIYSIEKVYRVN